MNDSLVEQWKKDENAQFEGWDFSYLEDRMLEEKPNWDYMAKAKELVRKSNSVLDIATGGGEKLAALGPFDGKKVVAIEGYKPNVAVAEKNLESLNIEVLYANDMGSFPFKDESFDLVLNRHGGLNIPEIARVLKKKGVFLTQQVSGDSGLDLIDFFNEKPKWPTNVLSEVKKKLTDVGMIVKQGEEWEGKISFKDVGALVYYLKAIPWIVDGFTVESHLPYLERLQEKIEKSQGLSFVSRRFLILAEKRD